jgi:hypothetical protein
VRADEIWAPPPGLDLDAWAYQELVKSAWDVETMKLTRITMARDTQELQTFFGNGLASAPAYVIPHFDRCGGMTDFRVAKLRYPYLRQDGKPVKYINPTGESVPACWFPPLPNVIEAVNTAGGLLAFTEGYKKAVACSLAGVPCVALHGWTTWSVPKTKQTAPKPDLAELNLQGKVVLVIPDFDDERKHGVEEGAVKFAGYASSVGADVMIPPLPPGPRRADGVLSKSAIDDFIDRHKAAAWLSWVVEQLAERPAPRSVAECRAEMEASRAHHWGRKGAKIDPSSTGLGKTYLYLMGLAGNYRWQGSHSGA